MADAAPCVLRTFLFAPGNHPRRVEKALSLGADAVILDLEDAVAVGEKASTRTAVVKALDGPRTCKAYIRINAIGTEWCLGDLMEVVRPGLDGIVLPKVESAADLRTIDWLVTNLERERGLPPGGIDLMPIIETAAGFSRLDRIFGARSLKDYGGPWRVKRMAFGAADFTNDVGMAWTPGEHLAARIADGTELGLWQRGGGKGEKPEPITRPGDVSRIEAEKSRRLARARRFQARARGSQ